MSKFTKGKWAERTKELLAHIDGEDEWPRN